MTKYVQRIKRPDGRIDLYFRKGAHRCRLASHDGSKELQEEIDTIVARLATLDQKKIPKPGTVGGMLSQYTNSADFGSLAFRVQQDYTRYGNEMITDIGAVLLREVTASWVNDLRDGWAPLGHRAASLRLQVLKNALEPAIVDKRIPEDPFARIKKVKPPHDREEPHPIWQDDEVEAAIALAIEREQPGLARAVGLGRWGGFRRDTICKIPLNARVTGHDSNGYPHPRLYWMTEKRKVLCDKPEDPRLTRLLKATPNRALTIAYNADSQPWKPRVLNQAVTRLLEALAKEGKARANLTPHGLRHSRGVELAMAGASDAEIMSQLEHATDRAAKIYRRQADRRKMADAAQDRIDKVIKLRSRRRQKSA